MSKDECSYCGGSDIERGLRAAADNPASDNGIIVLRYKEKEKVRWYDTGERSEDLLVDLCRECGSVHRLYVENPRRRWVRSARS